MAYKPNNPNIYQGKQVIINSDRLLFNAKDDSILLFSNKAISLSTNGSIHFDTSSDEKNSNFIVNCPNIYLGLDFEDNLPTAPAVKGDELEEFLNSLLDVVNSLWNATLYEVSYTESGTFTGPNPKNLGVEARIEKQINDLRKEIEFIKSKNVKLS
tara:strand:+ start:2687 stop:3154 length:468 start_codon:yes stop_codon:yes gene_type:complete